MERSTDYEFLAILEHLSPPHNLNTWDFKLIPRFTLVLDTFFFLVVKKYYYYLQAIIFIYLLGLAQQVDAE